MIGTLSFTETNIILAIPKPPTNIEKLPITHPAILIVEKIVEIKKKRSKNIPTVPCYLGEEKDLNPFLMFDNKKYLMRIGLQNSTKEENFRIIRGMKDNF